MMLSIEGFLEAGELKTFRRRLKRARWRDGARTAGRLSTAAKRNWQTDPACSHARELANLLLGKMGHHAELLSACLPHRIRPPVFNRYRVGEAYGAHVDAAVMPMTDSGEILRSDISMTLFLSPPDDYEGGELVIEGDNGAHTVKLAAGDMILYSSGAQHRVNPVTRGERLAAITWIQSLIPDAGCRSVLHDLDRTVQSLTVAGAADAGELLRLSAVYHNLVRRFSQV